MLSKNKYDVLLLGLNMPGMNGIGLYRRIEKEYPEAATKVIFMSADTPEQSFFTKANRPFLLKPFTTDDLLNTYRTHIEDHGGRAQATQTGK